MKINQRVTFVDAKGKSHAATITEVSGTGPSGYKTLNLAFNDGATGGNATNVPHQGDQQKGEGFWLLETETETPPERRAPLEKQPLAMAAAVETGALPSDDRRSEEDTASDARRKAVK